MRALLRILSAVAVILGLSGCGVPIKYITEDTTTKFNMYGEHEKVVQVVLRAYPDINDATNDDLYNLCYAYRFLRNYKRFFKCFDILTNRESNGQVTGEKNGENQLRSAYSIAGGIYFELGRYEDALQLAEKACEFPLTLLPLTIFPSNLRKRKEQNERYCSRNSLGVAILVHIKRQEFNVAKKKLQTLRNMFHKEREIGLKSCGFCSEILDQNFALGFSPYLMAIGEFEQVVALFGDFRFRKDQMFPLSYIGFFSFQPRQLASQKIPGLYMISKALYETGRLADAKQSYDQILLIPELPSFGQVYWQTLFGRGRIAETEGDHASAIEFYRRAIEVIERQRSTINTEGAKIGYLEDKQLVYYRMISVLVSEGRDAEAFEYVERAKARALVDLLAERQQFAPKELSDAELKELLDELARLEEESLILRPSAETEKLPSRDRALAEVKIRMSDAAPELASLVSVQPIKSSEIQRRVGPNETLVEYFYSDDGDVFAFVLTRTRVQAVRLGDWDPTEVVTKFRQTIKRVGTASYKRPVRELYDRLIAPLTHLFDRSNLTIVPHGILHYVPFNALHTGESFLIDQYAIRVLPSASVLTYLGRTAPPPDRDLMVLGNPDLGDPDLDLKGAESEALDIGRSWPQSMVLLRKQATETVVKKAGGQFQRLHFASHGVFDSDNPLKSGLLLAVDSQNDGRLTVGELYDLELNADLATLSACETGLGNVQNGDDVIGLTRGFLYAGARSIVASLWPVSDEATYLLMTTFYDKLKTLGRREALREAQLITRTEFPHPFFWAAFQITGDV